MFPQGTLPFAACLLLATLIVRPVPAQTSRQLPTQSSAPDALPATATTPFTTTAAQQVPEPAPQAFPSGQDTPLGTAISALLQQPAAARAHWGIAITQLDGTPVYGFEEGKLFRPASTAKLFTTAAAMALLGPDTRFTTRLYGNLDRTSGIVQGDLTIYGGGDPSFGTSDTPYQPHQASSQASAQAVPHAGLIHLANQAMAAGITQVKGDIIGDDTLFEAAAVPAGWADEDLLWGYGALTSALAVGDNELRVTIRPKPPGRVPGKPANWIGSSATVDQLYPYLKVNDDVVTLASEPGRQDAVDAESVPGVPQTVRVFGRFSPGAKPVVEPMALNDPAAYTAGALQQLLLAHGVQVTGTARPLHRPPAEEPVAFLSALRTSGCDASLWGEPVTCATSCPDTPRSTHLIAEETSAPLAQEIAFTLKTSANLHAEMLLHQIGLEVSCPGVTTLEGARVIRNWLLHIGLADHEFVFYDGSGLSTKDLVTPRAEAQLLAYAATQPWFAAWKAALPIAGVDGTLANRFTTSPLKGKVFAKTGTLGETRALAGYVQCSSGRELIFSILEDNHDPSESGDRQTAEKILEAVATMN